MGLIDEETGQPVLTSQEIAELAAIGVKTWHAYVARGQAPHPDLHIGRTSVWFRSTVDAWLDQRRKNP